MKRKLCLKFLALCVASVGFVFAKSSMTPVEVYAMESKNTVTAGEILGCSLRARFDARPGLEDAFCHVNSFWDECVVGVSALTEIEKLLNPGNVSVNVDVIRKGVRAYYSILNRFPLDKDLMVSWWHNLLFLQTNYPHVVIENKEVSDMLKGLYDCLVSLELLCKDDENLVFHPVMQ